jgi:ABC-type lipoprotein release transport system permease subunit
MEAVAIGVIGITLGVATGAVMLYYLLEVLHHDISGMLLPYEFPAGIVAGMVPVILCAAFVAAILPAEHAVRTSLTETLEYE